MRPPNDLKSEGRAVWRRLTADYDVTGNELVLCELARTADRLAEIRERMAKAALPDFLRLTNAEAKAAGTFARCWRLLGLQQADIPTRGGGGHAKTTR